MEFSKLNITEQSEVKDNEIRMNVKDGAQQLILKYITDMYENPLEAAFRETVNNACDAIIEAHGDIKTGLSIELNDKTVKIKDNGNGMTYAQLCEIYTQYGASTKALSNETTGAFGLGSKSPLAYTNKAIITTKTEQEGTLAITISRDENSFVATKPIKAVCNELTEHGTIVEFELHHDDDVKYAEKIINNIKSTLDTIPRYYTIGTTEVKDSKGNTETATVKITEQALRNISKIFNKDAYYCRTVHFNFQCGCWLYKVGRSYDPEFIIEVPSRCLTFTPSRDSLIAGNNENELLDQISPFILEQLNDIDVLKKILKFFAQHNIKSIGRLFSNVVNRSEVTKYALDLNGLTVDCKDLGVTKNKTLKDCIDNPFPFAIYTMDGKVYKAITYYNNITAYDVKTATAMDELTNNTNVNSSELTLLCFIALNRFKNKIVVVDGSEAKKMSLVRRAIINNHPDDNKTIFIAIPPAEKEYEDGAVKTEVEVLKEIAEKSQLEFQYLNSEWVANALSEMKAARKNRQSSSQNNEDVIGSLFGKSVFFYRITDADGIPAFRNGSAEKVIDNIQVLATDSVKKVQTTTLLSLYLGGKLGEETGVVVCKTPNKKQQKALDDNNIPVSFLTQNDIDVVTRGDNSYLYVGKIINKQVLDIEKQYRVLSFANRIFNYFGTRIFDNTDYKNILGFCEQISGVLLTEELGYDIAMLKRVNYAIEVMFKKHNEPLDKKFNKIEDTVKIFNHALTTNCLNLDIRSAMGHPNVVTRVKKILGVDDDIRAYLNGVPLDDILA